LLSTQKYATLSDVNDKLDKRTQGGSEPVNEGRSDLPVTVANAANDLESLPVVARLVVEIRSDGSRTIARGGLEDVNLGQRVTIEAHGDSPLQLAFALAKSLTKLPSFRKTSINESKPPSALRNALGARKLVRGLLGRKK
jgi:hypothetical protein